MIFDKDFSKHQSFRKKEKSLQLNEDIPMKTLSGHRVSWSTQRQDLIKLPLYFESLISITATLKFICFFFLYFLSEFYLFTGYHLWCGNLAVPGSDTAPSSGKWSSLLIRLFAAKGAKHHRWIIQWSENIYAQNHANSYTQLPLI